MNILIVRKNEELENELQTIENNTSIYKVISLTWGSLLLEWPIEV